MRFRRGVKQHFGDSKTEDSLRAVRFRRGVKLVHNDEGEQPV